MRTAELALKRLIVSGTSDPLWAQLTVALARDTFGAPLYFISMIEDVSAEREATEALAHQAGHDELTGLPNRTTLMLRTGEALARAAVSGRPMALLFCDLDHFKLVNDSRGHEAGDAILVETAERIQACIRDGDTAARLGGDEFVVLCEALPSRAHAEQVAQRLIDEITQPMQQAAGVTMTVSVGIALSEPGISASISSASPTERRAILIISASLSSTLSVLSARLRASAPNGSGSRATISS